MSSMSGCFSFFFSSRRRHTRYIGDWSSDVCSSDLSGMITFRNWNPTVRLSDCPADRLLVETDAPYLAPEPHRGRSEERRVGKSVDLGGRRTTQKKKNETAEEPANVNTRVGEESQEA